MPDRLPAGLAGRGPGCHWEAIDYLILGVYCIFVLGIGWMLRRQIQTGSDFLTSGRKIPAWIAGLAFLSANLGAQRDGL